VKKITRCDSSVDAVTLLELELHVAGDVKTTEKKIIWLSDHQNRVLIQTVDFDFLVAKDKLEEKEEVVDFLTP
jgi:glutamyl-tRNA synthetase